MQEYANVVVNSLPLILNPETKEGGFIRVYNYMTGMLQQVETKEDLAIFAHALTQCKEFARQNNLVGLSKFCAVMNCKGLKVLKNFNDLEQQKTVVNEDNQRIVTELQRMLRETYNIIHKTGLINRDDYTAAGYRLDEIQLYLQNNGQQYLTEFQISTFEREINNQRSHLDRAIQFFKDLNEEFDMLR